MHENKLDELLKEWRYASDSRDQASADLRDELTQIQLAIGALEEPYNDQIAALEAEIKALALERGSKYEASHVGAVVTWRNGYERVSFDAKQTDAVLGVLRDILPETAATLASARKVSTVAPSVGIKAVVAPF